MLGQHCSPQYVLMGEMLPGPVIVCSVLPGKGGIVLFEAVMAKEGFINISIPVLCLTL